MSKGVSPVSAGHSVAGILAESACAGFLLQSGTAPKAMPNLIGDVVERDPEPLDSASAPASVSAPSQPVLVLEVRKPRAMIAGHSLEELSSLSHRGSRLC